ncbi:MAG TPA: DUF2332 domain-containing protein [Solirubrobacteraceae bacterium]|nr:DUF2332 domain-containing protein [Solirubrobacteraceae bacterium]
MSQQTDPAVVADQAAVVAAAWSPPHAPPTWALTAAQFATLRDDHELLAIAATIPPDRLPPLLFSAAATFLVRADEPEPLRGWFPRLGEPQPPLGPRFAAQYRSFCLENRERLLQLCARHRYQMNEVGRCAHLLPALTAAIASGRALALIDIGTGAGLALYLDRYRYRFRSPGGATTALGDPGSAVEIATDVGGTAQLRLPRALPPLAERIGIDIEPLQVADYRVREWLTACLPQEIGAITRFHHAAELAAAGSGRLLRGDACDTLAEAVSSIDADRLICIVDSYVHVFFADEQLRRFRRYVDRLGAERDLDWISLDPLIPMGRDATTTVIGAEPPPSLLRRNRTAGAVFGVLARVGWRHGSRTSELLALGHPGAAWIEPIPEASPVGPAAA